MRRFSLLATVLITSFALTLAGLVASPIATASENESVRVSSRFAFGSPLLTNTHKSAIEKAVTTFGTDATFIVTAEAGKLPGVSDSEVQLLATKRGQVFKSHLVKLGVNKSSVTIKVKITRLGIVPKTKIVVSNASPLVTTATAVATNNAPPTSATRISVAAISGVTVPVTGATPVSTTTAGTGYTGTVTWTGSSLTFASATIYTATITLTPTSGYTLAGVAANFFTVAGATPVTNSANAGVITAVFPRTATTISGAAIAGVTAPVSGATPVTTTTAGTGYTGTVTWSVILTGTPITPPATFAPATTYIATITLTPTSGYTLTGVATNFFTVAGATSVTNPTNSGVITAVFPETVFGFV